MAEYKILLVEDDEGYREIVKDTLELTGKYEVITASNGMEGLDAYGTCRLDIIVTDVDMPKMTGLEMIKKIRETDKEIPVIITSALTTSKDIGAGYMLEIDDYFRKDYPIMELCLHIESVMRRVKSDPSKKPDMLIYNIGSYVFDYKHHILQHEDKIYNLTPRETELLKLLYDNRGEVVKRSEILTNFWGEDDFFKSRSLDVFISNIRKYFAEDASVQIVTVRAEGLKLIF